MDLIVYLYSVIDDILMPFFRFPDSPAAGYVLGITMLSIICVIFGELSIALSFSICKERIKQNYRNIERYHSLSIKALQWGRKDEYEACNSMANESFGDSFFIQSALAAASLWPALFALGWMQYRFAGVGFNVPLLSSASGYEAGYLSTFLFSYIMVRILFVKIKKILTLQRNSNDQISDCNKKNRPEEVSAF